MRSVPPGRPGPDAADLRLLAELARSSGSIGLPQAAWQTGMTQSEAAERMVAMAGAGLPLRLVVEGDPALLWQIVQRGPVRPAQPANPGYRIVPPLTPMPAPPPSAAPVAPALSPAAPASPASIWGIPGTASWTDRAPPDAAADTPVPPATTQAELSAVAAESAHAEAGPSSVAPFDDSPRVGTPLRTNGLSGERVTVTVTQLIDPGNDVLTAAGYRLDATERAVLVRTTLSNAGPADHDTMPDLYLFLVDAGGATLPKAPVSVAGHPAHRVGVAPGVTVDGWTIFLIDEATAVAAVRWCVRPDLVDRTLTWSV